MPLFDFSFIVKADPHSDTFEDPFIEAGCDDATFVLRRGTLALCFDREDNDYKSAVLSAYQDIRSAGAEIIRFEPDFLVSVSEIAQRAELTRAAVDLYIRGERRGGFPLPDSRFNAKSPLWDWVEVSQWLCKHDMIDHSEYKNALISRVINFGVQLNHIDPSIDFDIETKLALA